MAQAELKSSPRLTLLDRPLTSFFTLDWERVAWILLVVIAIVTRFVDLDARVISHDESLHTYYSWQLYKGQGFQHTPLMHGPFQFHALGLSYFLFGDSDFTARVPAALFGVAAVLLVWYFRRWLGRTGALLAGLFMTISPYILYYSRYVRNEAFVVVWALLMAIAMFRYFETRGTPWLYLMAGATSFMYTTKEVAFIFVALWMLFLGFIFIRDMLASGWRVPRYKNLFRYLIYIAFLALLLAGLFQTVGEDMLSALNPEATVIPADPNAVEAEGQVEVDRLSLPILIAIGIAGASLVSAAGLALASFRENMRRFASIDLLIILGTFVLPQLTAFPVDFILQADALDYSPEGLLRTVPTFLVLFVLSAAIGLLWDWRKWLIAAGIFYGIYIPLFTTLFTNGNGFATGLVGSLGYWLDQQGVQRGNQPWYYYIFLQTLVYEYLPAIGTLIATGFGFKYIFSSYTTSVAVSNESDDDEAAEEGGLIEKVELPTNSFPVLLFIGWWVVSSYAVYTYAGEKMPWLTVHLTLPMILLTGWSVGKLIDETNWKEVLNSRGWLAALLLPLFIFALGSVLGQVFGTEPPFRGMELVQLEATMAFLSAFAFLVGVTVAIYFVGQKAGWRLVGRLAGLEAIGLLTLFTARAAFVASYINYDNQTEFINYASGAPGVGVVMDQVEEISRRTTDGLGVRVAYDDDTSWPLTWYLRNYTGQVFYGGQPSRDSFNDVPLVIAGDSNWSRVEPFLGEEYFQFEYIRMWWPMQDYFSLNWDRIRNAVTDPNYREALWDIWYARDYTRYGELTDVNYDLSRWPVVDRMRFYVRRDLAAQLWDMGVGPTVLSEPSTPDPFEALWQDVVASNFWGSEGSAPGEFQRPRNVAVGPDNSVYVADTFNHRIQKYNLAGTLLVTWGQFGSLDQNSGAPGNLNEPWGIAVGADGSVYVADTWNHRIQKFDGDGTFITEWGHFGTDGALDAMWGPRDVAVGPDNLVYVADTGNKRIVVFDADGVPLRQVGSTGILDGELDEPVGIAVDQAGQLYVADTWNRRVQVFDENGIFLRKWDIPGWYGQSLENKPYIDVDNLGRVYVSDPESYRILIFDTLGTPLSSFGDFGFGSNGFALPAGIAWNGSNGILVADTDNNRIMQFQLDLSLIDPASSDDSNE